MNEQRERIAGCLERMAAEPKEKIGVSGATWLHQAAALLREGVSGKDGGIAIEGWARYDNPDWIQFTTNRPEPDGVLLISRATITLHECAREDPEAVAPSKTADADAAWVEAMASSPSDVGWIQAVTNIRAAVRAEIAAHKRED